LTPREVLASTTDPRAPFAQRTDLGWTIVGGIETASTWCQTAAPTQGRSTVVLKTRAKEVFTLNDYIQPSYLLNDDHPEETKQSYQDFRFLTKLTKEIRESDGHYMMPLPFKEENTTLPDNKVVAERRLEHLKRKLARDPVFKNDYVKFMEDMIEAMLRRFQLITNNVKLVKGGTFHTMGFTTRRSQAR
jgi:hypothetical protein